MGSPLGPTMADFSLAKMEICLLQQQLNFAPIVYFKYIDNIFAIFNNKADSMAFLDRLNSQHKNLQFTIESLLILSPFQTSNLRYTIIIYNHLEKINSF